jgi:adenylate cyclase
MPLVRMGMEHRLAAILHADVQGYSRLIAADEAATLRTLTPYLTMMNSLVQQHGGQAVGSRGDSLLAEFPSVVEAVRCAVKMQSELRVRNAELPADKWIQFRMSINLGEIVEEGGQVHGEGINIAVRLEGLADAGSIYISEVMHEQVRNRLPFQYEYVGERELKNIEKPVRVWRVVMEVPSPLVGEGQGEGVSREAGSSKFKVQSPRLRRVGTAHRAWVVVGGLAIIMGVVVTVRYLSRPSLSTQDSALRTEAAPAALPLPDKPSIVVLPFVNLSGDSAQEYFSDGITEDLTTALAKVSALFVIVRNSAFTYKGKPVDIKAVSRELGVRYVLEGSVQRADNRVRITAQLVDGLNAAHVWAESYDRELKDIFALQDEVRQKIVLALKVKLTPEEQERFKRFPTNNLEAYDLLLRGVEAQYRHTKEANVQARQMYEKALALDPQYAAAYTWLGWTYLEEWALGWNQDPQVLERAFELTQRALALDDSLSIVHAVLGDIYLFKKQHEQAIAELEETISLDPNYADGYSDLGYTLSFAGRPEEAIGLIQKGMRLDPHGHLAPWLWALGQAYGLTGRYEEAIAAHKKALSRNPEFWPAHLELAVIYSEQGREEEARAEAEILRLNPNFSLEVWRQNVPYKDPAVIEHHVAALRKAGLQ